MSTEWLTLSQAAEQLGISARTCRRWIREGKLQAELAQGPYGPQYTIAADQINTVQQIKDVVTVHREADLPSVVRIIAETMDSRLVGMTECIDTLRAEVTEAVKSQTEDTSSQLEEVTKQIDELMNLLQQMQQNQLAIVEQQDGSRRHWWQFGK
jgi:excisionase family DNA binding protein